MAIAIPAFAPVERPVFEEGREIDVGEDVEAAGEDVMAADEDVEVASERVGEGLGLGEPLVLEAEVLLLDGAIVLAVEAPDDVLDIDVTVIIHQQVTTLEKHTHAPDADAVTPIAQ